MRECVGRPTHTKKGKEKKKTEGGENKRASVTGGSSGDPAPADTSEKSTIRKLVWFFWGFFFTLILLFYFIFSFDEESRNEPFSGIRSQTKGDREWLHIELNARPCVISDGGDIILI